MLKIADQTCYSGAEIVERAGAPYTLKRLEHLRTLGLVPRPIKVGTGNGTIGYYPEQVIDLLREIERKHSEGKSYPDVVHVMGDKVILIEYKMHKLKDEHKANVAARQVESYRRLIAEKHLGTSIKLHDISVLESKNQDYSAEISALRGALSSLFKKKDHLRMSVLLRIKANIEKLQQIESMKAALESARAELAARTKG